LGSAFGGRFFVPTHVGEKLRITLLHTEKSSSGSYHSYLKPLSIEALNGLDWLHKDDLTEILQTNELYPSAMSKKDASFNLTIPAHVTVLEALIQQNNSDMLIIDTLGKLIPDESSNKDVKPYMDSLHSIANRLNIYILAVHHPRKTSNEQDRFAPFDEREVAGAASFTNQATSVFGICRVKDANGAPKKLTGRLFLVKEGSKNPEDFKDLEYTIVNDIDSENGEDSKRLYVNYVEHVESSQGSQVDVIYHTLVDESVVARKLGKRSGEAYKFVCKLLASAGEKGVQAVDVRKTIALDFGLSFIQIGFSFLRKLSSFLPFTA
jgi:hypothetical protein